MPSAVEVGSLQRWKGSAVPADSYTVITVADVVALAVPEQAARDVVAALSLTSRITGASQQGLGETS
jgi:hypothetical protein